MVDERGTELRLFIFLGMSILLVGYVVQPIMVFATTVAPVQTEDYAITNSPIAKRLLPFKMLNVTTPTNTTENAAFEEQTKNTPLKVNQRSLETFQMLIEEARKKQMQTYQELQKISVEIRYQEEQSVHVYSEKLQMAKTWSNRINEFMAYEENQTKQETKADLKQAKTIHPKEISQLRTVANKIVYNWAEIKDEKWSKLIKRSEQLKTQAEEAEKRFEEQISKTTRVRYG